MDGSTNKTNGFDHKKIQEELSDMRSKYDYLSKDIEKLQSGQVSLRKDIDTINSGFEKISANFEQVITKLDKLTSQREESMLKDMSEKTMFQMRMVKRPLSRLFVGTLTSMITITGSVLEKVSIAMKKTEDIIAEAHYESRKKRMNTINQE